MQDRQSLYPGRIKLTPVSGEADTYDLVRADQPTNEGTALNKANFLTDATAALFGLGVKSVPNDVLALIGNSLYNGLGNQYLWAVTSGEQYISKSSVTSSFDPTYAMTTVVIAYANEAEIVDNAISLVSPTEVEVTSDNVNSVVAALPGKYFKISVTGNEYFESFFGYCVSVTNDQMYLYISYQSLSIVDAGETTYVNSSDPFAYPPSEDDGLTYTALGRLGDKANIATGTYSGTGTSGSSNPNRLTFDFKPKIVFIFRLDGYTPYANTQNTNSYFGIYNQVFYYGGKSFGVWNSSSVTGATYYTLSGNTLSWYNSHQMTQMNNNGSNYGYIAIG